jgi:AAHS family 4-hydroxybenzoate transporter-like MFS transporter
MGTVGGPDLDSIIDSAGTSRFQRVVIAVGAAVLIVDGFDTQSIAFAAPAIAAEYAPTRARATVAALTFCGIPLGSVLGSVLASQLIPTHGWGSAFVIAGVVCVACALTVFVIGRLVLRAPSGRLGRLDLAPNTALTP